MSVINSSNSLCVRVGSGSGVVIRFCISCLSLRKSIQGFQPSTCHGEGDTVLIGVVREQSHNAMTYLLRRERYAKTLKVGLFGDSLPSCISRCCDVTQFRRADNLLG